MKEDKIRVLILPHAIPHKKLRARTIEIAKELAKDKNFKIYVLERSSVYEDLVYGLKNVFKKEFKFREENNLTFVRVPYIPTLIEPILLYNRKLFHELIEELDIQVVISNFSHSFPAIKSEKLVYIYDYADDYVEFHKNLIIKILMSHFIKAEIAKCDLLTTVTQFLGEKIKSKKWKDKYEWLISGVNPNFCRDISFKEISMLRERYSLKDKYVIGHIGYQNKRAGTKFLIEVFEEAKRKISNLALLIVGGGPIIKKWKKKYEYGNEKNIVFTGPVAPENVAKYFLVSDIGVLPYIDHPSTHARFPVRLLDFIAAKKIVIAWPFGDLRFLKFPNVILAEREVDKWVEAILKTKEMKWQPEWDYLLEEFSTTKITHNFKNRIFALLEKKNIIK